MTTLFLIDLLLHLHIPFNEISNFTFINNIVIIFFNSDNSYYTFTSKKNGILRNIPTLQTYIFIKNVVYLKENEVNYYTTLLRKMWFHLNTKCTYNNSNETYELRYIVNSKVDWKSIPINITSQTYKTTVILINTSQILPCIPSIYINNNNIKYTPYDRNLGITIDEKLTFSQYTTDLSKSVNRTLHTIRL